MKKTLVATILGLVTSLAAVSSSYGQGQVWMDTYNANSAVGALTTYGAGSGGTVGAGVDSTFHAVLYYSLGNSLTDVADASDVGAGLTLVAGSTAQYNVGPTAGSPGYFVGSIVTIPDYVSGPITFEIVAFNGADYASSTVRGKSGTFVLPSIATGTTQPGFFDGLPNFQVFSAAPVPEPSTFALAGLGLAGLLIFRRRK